MSTTDANRTASFERVWHALAEGRSHETVTTLSQESRLPHRPCRRRRRQPRMTTTSQQWVVARPSRGRRRREGGRGEGSFPVGAEGRGGRGHPPWMTLLSHALPPLLAWAPLPFRYQWAPPRAAGRMRRAPLPRGAPCLKWPSPPSGATAGGGPRHERPIADSGGVDRRGLGGDSSPPLAGPPVARPRPSLPATPPPCGPHNALCVSFSFVARALQAASRVCRRGSWQKRCARQGAN